MKLVALYTIISFIGGAATALLIVLPLVMPGPSETTEYVRVEQRVIYKVSGALQEAYFSFPTLEEFYKALSDASGCTIITDDLPRIPYSYSAKIGNWEDVIRFSAPYGLEVVPEGENSYRIRKIPK